MEKLKEAGNIPAEQVMGLPGKMKELCDVVLDNSSTLTDAIREFNDFIHVYEK